MLKCISEGSRLLAIAIFFATMTSAQAQSQSNKPIILTVKPDLSVSLGSDVVTRDGLVAALEAATNGNRNERIYVRADEGVSQQDLMAVAIALGSAGYVKIAVVLNEQQTALQTQMTAMRTKIMAHWNPSPAIWNEPDKYVVVVRVQLDRDGRLSAPPQVISKGSGPLYQVTAEAARRAVEASQPFDMFSPSTYDVWKDAEIKFDPRTGAPPR
jgi:biopolymer transport protein ExbD